MRLSQLEPIRLCTPDKVEILLTRYQGGTKGPVLLVHGASVWSGMFSEPTLPENFVQFLMRHRYDVWLLDWRASIHLALRQFTLDEAAQNDFHTAVEEILSRTGVKTVQAVVHCVGSIAFFMAMARGLLPQVRCVVCSQVALHPTVGFAMRLKVGVRLASLLAATKMTHVSPLADPQYPVFNTLFRLLVNAVHHECDSTSCHRMTFMYGHMYPHNNISVPTHGDIPEQYGPCNILTLKHLQQGARLGYFTSYDYGTEANRAIYKSATPPSYVEDASHFKLPILFVSGSRNRIFLPETTQLTFDWLRRENDPGLYTREVIPSFGHFDNFVGTRASQISYPCFLNHLERYP